MNTGMNGSQLLCQQQQHNLHQNDLHEWILHVTAFHGSKTTQQIKSSSQNQPHSSDKNVLWDLKPSDGEQMFNAASIRKPNGNDLERKIEGSKHCGGYNVSES